MKVKVTDNGNVVAIRTSSDGVASHINFDNRSWLYNNINSQIYNTNHYDNYQFHSNFNYFDSRESSDTTKSLDSRTEQSNRAASITNAICNRQYRLNIESSGLFLKSLDNKQTTNLEGDTQSAFSAIQKFSKYTNVSSNASPVDEERTFEQSDADEMSENSVALVPRGIVNPNYPGFQHLAHTLQDYPESIENFYPSENEMTDDDADLDITDTYYEFESNRNNSIVDCENIKNNNNGPESNETIQLIKAANKNDKIEQFKTIENESPDDIPDLLKNVSRNNNNIVTTDVHIPCTDADIENNFDTKDIIGDFNKEIQDEIKQLLNYNINIQDDLEELRKDIKDTFAKPIENTLNNISDVVNQVIMKLVETQTDSSDQDKNLLIEEQTNTQNKAVEIATDVNKENETNTRTEMNLSRPTFLLIENNEASEISDAYLSDAKDDINDYVNEYDTELLTTNVEKTIQQLSTELRKIIPKLEEMREQDRVWVEKQDVTRIITDNNSNEIASTSICYTCTPGSSIDHNKEVTKQPVFSQIKPVNRKIAIATRIESRSIRDWQKDKTPTQSSYRSAQSNASVRKNDANRDCELDIFDVYNIETALPKLDLDAIESHLKAAKEAERRKRNDREEIRKRLATGADSEEYYSIGHIDRPGKKPSLHSRLQSGMNLQVCFMNETASDNESQASDIEKNVSNISSSRSNIFTKSNFNHPYQTQPLSVNISKHDKNSAAQSGAKLRPPTLATKTPKSRSAHSLGHIELRESDFYLLQATLQTEARVALAQAKELARIQMERERRSRPVSPVTEMLRRSLQKANAPLAPDRRRASRQLLTDMNIAQLQVIVNELHSQIESLNDSLVKLLMSRDELHMSQDSMLVDIEDLTRYLGVKEQNQKTKGAKSGVRRLASLVHK